MIELEKFKKILKSVGGETVEGSIRKIKLNALETIVVFEWYVNQGSAYINNIQIRYDNITIDGHWPNGFKNNINLEKGSETIAVIAIEKYK